MQMDPADQPSMSPCQSNRGLQVVLSDGRKLYFRRAIGHHVSIFDFLIKYLRSIINIQTGTMFEALDE